MAESKKAPRVEEEEWTPLKRPLLLLGSLSLASSFVAYKKKHLNWFKTSYACACVTFGPAMVLYALPERSEAVGRETLFCFLLVQRRRQQQQQNNDRNNDRNNNRNNRNDDDSSKRREEREKETKRKNKEMLERMKRVKL
jgi:hypothetical protein